jgi:hypothetical protein
MSISLRLLGLRCSVRSVRSMPSIHSDRLIGSIRLIRSMRSIRSIRPALTAGLLCLATSAHAVLGGAPTPPPADATAITRVPVAHAAFAFAASSASSSVQGASGGAAAMPFTVTQTTLASGTLVREYVSQAGIVFGIAWSGPRMPDLPTLLGNYFPQYVSSVEAWRAQHPGRGPVSLEGSALVVRSGGHMGSFLGQAWLPQALPAGMSGKDIQ